MGLEDDERDRLLDMPQSKMGDVANFCNAFPNVEMDFEVQESDDITAGDPVTLVVSLEREGEEDEDEPEGGWGKVSAFRLCLGFRSASSRASCGGCILLQLRVDSFLGLSWSWVCQYLRIEFPARVNSFVGLTVTDVSM